MDQALAPSTRRSYHISYQMFKNFSTAIGKKLTTALKDGSIELWLAQLSERGLSHGSVRSHLSALRFYCARRGLSAHLDSPRIQLILKGIRKNPTKKSLKKPVATRYHLNRLISAAKLMLKKNKYCRFASMVTLTSYGLLWPSEYCITPAGHNLQWKSITFSRQKKSVRLTFKSYKHSREKSTLQLATTDSYHCPIKWLLSYMTLYKDSHGSSLFEVTVKDFRATLHEVRKAANIKTKLTPHSFRHGGASWASNQGWSDARIRAHGRWHSDAYKRYIRAY